MSNKEIITIVEQAVIRTATLLGIGETEMSYSRASAQYGKFFQEMVRAGRLRPCRKGKGKNGTHWYAVKDIVLLRAEESEKAKLT